jgi:hypothetical protein
MPHMRAIDVDMLELPAGHVLASAPCSTLSCADSVKDCTPAYQAGRRGSIPASALHFCSGQAADAAALVKQYHYSGRIPSNIQFIGTLHMPGGLFGDFGEAIAAIYFGIPPTRWGESVLELTRLVRKDGVRVPLTLLIKLAASRLKADGHDLPVSFADAAEGHHGGVYQAGGWNYHGQRERAMDGLMVNGRFVPGRSCNSAWGTRSPERLKEKHPDWQIEPHYDIGKHLYWRALGRKGEAKAARLELKRNPYPKTESCGSNTR